MNARWTCPALPQYNKITTKKRERERLLLPPKVIDVGDNFFGSSLYFSVFIFLEGNVAKDGPDRIK